jgi:uncharacterized protein
METDSSKKGYRDYGASGAVVMFFILLFVFAKWGPAIPFSVLSQPKGEPMVVSGEGKSTAVPDVAMVNAGIEDRGQSLKQVQDNVNKKSQALVKALKDLGVEEKDIKTTNYNIYPQSDYASRPPTVTGYQVSISYSVKVKDVDKVNEVLTTVTAAGANLVGGVSFELSDEAKAKAVNEAREDAVKTAKESAQSLAKASGVTLGRIINISESQSGNYPRPMYAADSKVSAVGGGMLANTQPEVQPGTTETSLTVSLYYEVR